MKVGNPGYNISTSYIRSHLSLYPQFHPYLEIIRISHCQISICNEAVLRILIIASNPLLMILIVVVIIINSYRLFVIYVL